MEEVSLNTEPVGDDDGDELETEADCAMTEYVSQGGILQGGNPLPPSVGMEFDSYDDVYYFYNCYAKDRGFGVRVSNTWYRKSKERYRGKLSCSSAGFKKKSDANRPRPETRTGCPAMIKFRLMDTKRWRIIEVELEHNHLISPASGKFYKSHKNTSVGTKRALQLDGPDETQKVKLFRTVIVDAEVNGNTEVEEEESDKYDLALQKHYQLESLADLDSKNPNSKTRCYFELQLSRLYTNNILRRFEREVEGMYSCFCSKQSNSDGPIMTYIVKEQTEVNGNVREARDYEVLFNPPEMEVICVCGMFNLRGYLCRHALSVLSQNGMEEIPAQYILSRWRKDLKRKYVVSNISFSSDIGIDVNNPVHRYDHLYKCIVQVVDEGRKSQDLYKVSVQALEEILNKLRLAEQDHLSRDSREMKFKAFLTENGVCLLEKRFLPALDKMGKICHLYLTRDHAIFLHNLLNGDGIQSIAQFRKEALFDDYRISSQNEDRIAFSIDVSLFHRALRSSVSICTEFGTGPTANRLQIKLVKKLPVNSTHPMPFLTFETKGFKSAVIQDVPISKPLSRAQLLELQTALDMAQDLPQTLVQVPDMNQLQSFVDRMKHLGELLNVSITKYGDLHVQISRTLITLGAEFRKLFVIGAQAEAPAEDRNLSAQTRSSRAIERGDGQSVQVSVKHFAKSLCYHMAKPDCAFYGIAPQGACLTVIFQFFIPGSRQMDKSISLHCRLPVLDPGTT
ncbi:hypothetical protein F8388_026992 [Cannabis sativa]|nr:hypothetical protein F8388_026080 [Cannabis sativa]KAF4372319.1 hypothetical protein F8388_026992 [Cannabis sativa]